MKVISGIRAAKEDLTVGSSIFDSTGGLSAIGDTPCYDLGSGAGNNVAARAATC